MVSQQFVLAGGNNITLSESINAQSATVTISAFNQSVQTQNLIDLTLAGNTSGTLALMSSGTVTIAGGNNITLSQAGNAITISAGNTGLGNTFSAGISTIGNTAGNSGTVSDQLVIAGGSNITLSQSINAGSATVTISVPSGAAPTLSMWQNMARTFGGNDPRGAFSNGFMSVCDLDPKNGLFPGNMTVSTAYLAISASTNLSIGFSNHSGTLKLGVYTRNASTLSLLNSVSTTWGIVGGPYAASLVSGIRWVTIHSSLWSAAPTFSNTDYYLGYVLNTTGVGAGYSFIGDFYFGGATNQPIIRSGTFGVSQAAGISTAGWEPFCGNSQSSIANTAALPASIQLSELTKSDIYLQFPYVVFMNLSSNF